MKTLKKILPAAIAAAAVLVTAAPAQANSLEGSVGVASMYLFRGMDAGDGAPEVYGDITWDIGAGIYASAWMSNSSSGPETDFIAGWSQDFGGFTIDIGAVNYYYAHNDDADNFGDSSEAYLGLGFAGVEFYYYDNVAGSSGYSYFSLGYSYDKYSILFGQVEDGGQRYIDEDFPNLGKENWSGDYQHIDFSYAMTDNLTFTVSQVIDRSASIDSVNYSKNSELNEMVGEDDTLFVVSYNIPIQ